MASSSTPVICFRRLASCCSIRLTGDIVLDYAGMADALVNLASQSCGREHLRTYWYDGERDLVPTAQQLEIANLPRMKLRLGRLTGHGQKGVDSRIVRDLITLSIERPSPMSISLEDTRISEKGSLKLKKGAFGSSWSESSPLMRGISLRPWPWRLMR